MKDPLLRPTPPCVCRHRELAHTGDAGRCVNPGCDCVGYWPGDTVTVKQATTRPVAR